MHWEPLFSCGTGVQISALCTPRNPTLGRVIDRNFDRNLVAGQNFDIVHSEFAGNMRGNDHIIRQFHLESRVWKCFYDDTFKFDYIILRQILFLPDRFFDYSGGKRTVIVL
jgi:hypothetical protein